MILDQKSFAVASYAAGASLAAVALVYVFAPNYLLDESDSGKKGAIGLVNVGNDCFINSTLQALAGLSELRLFLIRETYRRTADGDAIYENMLVQPEAQPSARGTPGTREVIPEWKLKGLQMGKVTAGLKTILDQLNERPVSRKTLSPREFVRVIESSFGQTINRQQQDAQEFLQLIFERLKDEYYAAQRVHRELLKRTIEEIDAEKPEAIPEEKPQGIVPASTAPADTDADTKDATRSSAEITTASLSDTSDLSEQLASKSDSTKSDDEASVIDSEVDNDGLRMKPSPDADPDYDPYPEEPGFPMDGEKESHLTCQTCQYSTPSRFEPFTMLTLSVPHTVTASLKACFDRVFAPEYISDFKCEKCRLIHAAEMVKAHVNHPSTTPENKARAELDFTKLQAAIDTDPENPPKDVQLPDISKAPKRTIARTTRINKFPRVLVVHLSRSIYDRTSQKNMAKVAFPEDLPLGDEDDLNHYRLISAITHRGGHTSGHYESFRRQYVSTASKDSDKSSFFKRSSFTPVIPITTTSLTSTPANPIITREATRFPTSMTTLPNSLSSMGSLSSTLPSAPETPSPGSTATVATVAAPPSDTASIRSAARSVLSRSSTRLSCLRSKTLRDVEGEMARLEEKKRKKKERKRRRANDKWWRISDEKCKQAKTSEVLGMQREVYMLFYELEKGAEAFGEELIKVHTAVEKVEDVTNGTR